MAYLNNAVVWMVSTRPLISKSSSPFINYLVTEASSPITIGINVTFMFHSFFQFSSKVYVLIFLFVFLPFYPLVSWNGKVYYSADSFFVEYLEVWLPDRDLVVRLYIKILEKFMRLIFLDRFWVVFVWLNLNFLHNSQWIPFFTQSYLILYNLLLIIFKKFNSREEEKN